MNRLKQKNQKKLFRKRRSRAKIFGTAAKPRLTVFRSNRYVYAQLINDETGRTIAAAFAKDPRQAGAALSAQASQLGIKTAVFQKGSYKYHGRIKILAETVRKAGLKI